MPSGGSRSGGGGRRHGAPSGAGSSKTASTTSRTQFQPPSRPRPPASASAASSGWRSAAGGSGGSHGGHGGGPRRGGGISARSPREGPAGSSARRREEWMLGEESGRPFRLGRRYSLDCGAKPAGAVDPPRADIEIYQRTFRVKPGEADPMLDFPNTVSDFSPGWMRAPLQSKREYFTKEHQDRVFKLNSDDPIKRGIIDGSRDTAVSAQAPDFMRRPFECNEQLFASGGARAKAKAKSKQAAAERPRRASGTPELRLRYQPDIWDPFPSSRACSERRLDRWNVSCEGVRRMKNFGDPGLCQADREAAAGRRRRPQSARAPSSRSLSTTASESTPIAGVKYSPEATCRFKPVEDAVWREED